MLLVAVHHVGARQCAQQAVADRVRALAPDIPGPAQRPDAQRTHGVVGVGVAEGHERRRHDLGHRACQLERVAFRSADDPVRAETRWHQVHDAHGYFRTSSS